jgi:hypothetical protein
MILDEAESFIKDHEITRRNNRAGLYLKLPQIENYIRFFPKWEGDDLWRGTKFI